MTADELGELSKDKLIEIIDNLEEDKNKLEMSVADLQCENSDYQFEVESFEEVDKEEVAELAFNSGFEASERKEAKMRAWLNYKVEARL